MADSTTSENSRTGWLIGLGILAVWGAYLLIAVPRMDSRGLPRPEISAAGSNQRVQYAWKLEDLDGNPVDFAAFRGRTLFLNLWATWCPPCVAEMPSIDRLSKNPQVKNVAFACISSDDDLDDLRAFVRQRKLTVPVYRMIGAPPEVFQTEAIPATFVVSGDGRVAMKEVGAAEWDSPATVQFLEGLSAKSNTAQ